MTAYGRIEVTAEARIGEIVTAVLERDVGQRFSFLQQAWEEDEQLR